MPPKESERLSTEESNWLREWIDEDAPWPAEDKIKRIQAAYSQGVTVATSGGLSTQWTERRYEKSNLWAYQPLQFSEPPAGDHPVDWFINRKLVENKLTPAPSAEAHELLRRMTFGLTGLPPETQANWPRIKDFEAAYRRTRRCSQPPYRYLDERSPVRREICGIGLTLSDMPTQQVLLMTMLARTHGVPRLCGASFQ